MLSSFTTKKFLNLSTRAFRPYSLSSPASFFPLPTLQLLQSHLSNELKSKYGEDILQSRSPSFLISPSSVPQKEKENKEKDVRGDYQSNSAMILAKILKKKPIEVAEDISEMLKKSNIVKNAEVSGPGFVNIFLSDDFINQKLTVMSLDKSGRVGAAFSHQKEKIAVDFSSPNVAKEMHVGHLRSTIIGDTLCNILTFLGHNVLRINHIGDWGTQFGMLLSYLDIKEAEHKKMNPTIPFDSTLSLSSLALSYKESKLLFDTDENFSKISREMVQKLQSNQYKDIQKKWERILEISRKEFNKIYEILDVKLEERGESFYNEMLPWIIHDLEEKNLITVSDGAKCIFLESYKQKDGTILPLIVQKSDGAFLYATTDLAAFYHRANILDCDRLLYVTDAGQAEHFERIFQAARAANYTKPSGRFPEVVHVPFGLVLGEDGKKIKSRSGETIKLKDLLDEAVDVAYESLKERENKSQEGEAEKLEQEKEGDLLNRSFKLGISSVKYSDLSLLRTKNYSYNSKKMLALQGNTAAYMFYSYVRLIKMIKKNDEIMKLSNSIRGSEVFDKEDEKKYLSFLCTEIINQLKKNNSINLFSNLEEDEINLVKHLIKSDEIIYDVGEKLLPNRMCEYIYELSQKFNSFYESCPVLKEENQEKKLKRLLFCALTASVLNVHFSLLGLKTIDKF